MGMFGIGGDTKATQRTTNQQVGLQGTSNIGVSTGSKAVTALGGFAGTLGDRSTVNLYSMDVAALEANQKIAEAAIAAGQINTAQSLELVRQQTLSTNDAISGLAALSGEIAYAQTPAGFSDVLSSQSAFGNKQMIFALILVGAMIGLTLYLRK